MSIAMWHRFARAMAGLNLSGLRMRASGAGSGREKNQLENRAGPRLRANPSNSISVLSASDEGAGRFALFEGEVGSDSTLVWGNWKQEFLSGGAEQGGAWREWVR
jgi:hypothetical protein